MQQLDEVRAQIDKTLNSLQSLFSQIKKQDAFSLRRDKAFGSRVHTIRIVWDEFSPAELAAAIPRIETLHTQYLDQREAEREILFGLQIDRNIEQRTGAGTGKALP